MSRTYKVENVPATTHKVIDKTICDLCKRETAGDNWEKSDWQVTNTTNVSTRVSAKCNRSYWGDGGEGAEIIIDLCPWCFRDKLMPWLREQGANIEVKEYDW